MLHLPFRAIFSSPGIMFTEQSQRQGSFFHQPMSMTVNPLNDIYKQAHQGSVAAIIQVLNDKLSNSGVRTRAIFANGILQLLCEAPTEEQLEQTMLTDRVRKILESIAPRNIRRVNINSRIVREQQLLWLEEINRDPDGQLLWSKEITLSRQNFFKRVREDLRDRSSNHYEQPKSVSPHLVREKRQFTKGIVGGLALSAVLVLVGWGVYRWQSDGATTGSQAPSTPLSSSTAPTQSRATQDQKLTAPVQANNAVQNEQDAFAAAVRLAEQASDMGRTAQTPEQWRELASMWGKASDLMGSVTVGDKRYAIAQDRTALYRRYEESALQKVK